MITKIAIALPAYRPIDPRIDLQRMLLASNLTHRGIDWVPIGPMMQCPYLDRMLDSLVHGFLKTDAEALVMLDDDVLFDWRDVFRLLESGRDVVGGDYPLKALEATGGACFHTPGGRVEGNYQECDLLGLGLCFFTRAAIEQLVEEYRPTLWYRKAANEAFSGELVVGVFKPEIIDGDGIAADAMFFRRLRAVGITPWCDRTIDPGHVGSHVYRFKDQKQ